MALRAALGASRGRLSAQLLTEAGLLAIIGGILGLGLAVWGLESVKRLANMPELLHAHIDGSVVGFVGLVVVLCGALFGLGPARNGSRTDFHEVLSGTTRSTT